MRFVGVVQRFWGGFVCLDQKFLKCWAIWYSLCIKIIELLSV
jgi:hypothetical protein